MYNAFFLPSKKLAPKIHLVAFQKQTILAGSFL